MSWSLLPEFPNGTRHNACLVCNSDLRQNPDNTHELAISTGIYIDFEGLLCICQSCLTEAARLLDLIPASEIERLQKNNRELGRQNRQLKDEQTTAKRTIADLTSLFRKP